jgi:hypothetical protein
VAELPPALFFEGGDDSDTLEMRFPVLQGSELWAVVKFVYITDTSAKLLIIDADGRVSAKRHPVVNAIQCLPQSNQYCDDFLKSGPFEALRSVIIHSDATGAIDHASPNMRFIINGGTLIDGILMACEKDPNNRHVLRVKAEGLSDTFMVDPRTPLGALRYMKNEANNHQVGRRNNFVEALDVDIDVSDAAWTKHMDTHKIKASKCPSKGPFSYHNQCEAFIFGTWKPKDQSAELFGDTCGGRLSIV